jgi:hypothetical protein
MLDRANKWVIGERVAGTSTYLATQIETIQTRWWYKLEVILSADTATLQVRSVTKASRTFASERAVASESGSTEAPSPCVFCLAFHSSCNCFRHRLLWYRIKVRQDRLRIAHDGDQVSRQAGQRCAKPAKDQQQGHPRARARAY